MAWMNSRLSCAGACSSEFAIWWVVSSQMAKLFFVDEGVVDAVDHELAELGIACAVLIVFAGDVVPVAESLEEVLIDDVRARWRRWRRPCCCGRDRR